MRGWAGGVVEVGLWAAVWLMLMRMFDGAADSNAAWLLLAALLGFLVLFAWRIAVLMAKRV